ncbi:MAG TPA: hypothetical protein ACFYDZ_08370 [Candidatus Brocadiaceae bacterium]
MFNGRKKRMMFFIGSGLAVLTMSGCAIKHSDVMLFGTNTKYGLSIAADAPENTPHINVGYKRQEFVWLPLVANGADSVIQTKVATANAQDLKYIGKEPTGKEDTYSVLASFGAQFSAGRGGAGGGIAQYFATGIAARKLAEVGGASLVQASEKNLTPNTTELTNPTPGRLALRDEYDKLVKKQLKPNFTYPALNKAYTQDQVMQYANDYVAKEIEPQSNADQIRATGTDEQLKKLVDALTSATQS